MHHNQVEVSWLLQWHDSNDEAHRQQQDAAAAGGAGQEAQCHDPALHPSAESGEDRVDQSVD